MKKLNQIQLMFMERTDSETADDLLITVATLAMEQKLELKRDEGYGGWHTTECSKDRLTEMLIAHVNKGDMVDVMNIAAMIYMREQLYGVNHE